MSQSERMEPESGLRSDRVEWLREDTTGEIPADPDWSLYSDVMNQFTWSPDPGTGRQDGLGTPYAHDHFSGMEEQELTIAYDLQRPVVDAAGDPDDASYDAVIRAATGFLPYTHAVVERETRGSSLDEADDVSGARVYTVAKGGHPDVTYEGDPEEGQPIPVELTYQFEKIRSYEFKQPDVSSLIAVDSTDADDTTVDVTIENEDGSQSETVTLSGTTPVSTSAEFEDIDAVELSEETMGDVTVYINDGTATEPTLGTVLTDPSIRGAMYYSDDEQPLEGDLGVPAIGAGSHATEIGTTFEHFLGDRVERPAGTSLAPDINNFTVETDNGFDMTARHDTQRPRVSEGNVELTISADVIGERSSHTDIMDALGTEGLDLEWELSHTQFTFYNATYIDPGERGRESDDAAVQRSVELEPSGDPAVEVEHITR